MLNCHNIELHVVVTIVIAESDAISVNNECNIFEQTFEANTYKQIIMLHNITVE